MHIRHHLSLLPYNTFGMDVPAEALVEITAESQLPELSELPVWKRTLGGGSNVLLTRPVQGLVLLNRIPGIAVEREDASHIWLRVGAGENWHQFVLHCIDRGLGGVENLALIPGTVGASPIQNIGAYGVEVKDAIESVRFWHWEDKSFTEYDNVSCRFGYRDSIFKQELKDKIFVTSVLFRLSKQPEFHTSYGAIAQELERMNVSTPSVKAIADAVISIRRSKLPDPMVIGNAGSFFKNPTVPNAVYQGLKENNPAIPSYPVDAETVKIPAGWLIEQCGWKGVSRGPAAVHDKQALVLVNKGTATGQDIWNLSEEIVQSVQQRFGIVLEREVQVW